MIKNYVFFKFITVFEDSEKVQQMGKNAREKVEQTFDIEKIVNQNIDFYSKQIKE